MLLAPISVLGSETNQLISCLSTRVPSSTFFSPPLPIFPQFLVSPLSVSRSFISAGLCNYVTGKGVVHTLFLICWSLYACGRWICCTSCHVRHSFKMLCQVKNSSPYDSPTADQCPF